MRIAFRTDASLKIGTGHVMRCLTLADKLREQGDECHFICQQHEGHFIDHVQSRGYEIDTLQKPDANVSFKPDLAHGSWLGMDWSIDAQETHQILREIELDWLIVDHYALDYRWERTMRSTCKQIMVIDDLADRRHDCDLLLDQNYGSSALRYSDLVPESCLQFYGPDYALLKPTYSNHRAQLPTRDDKVRSVLIYFGGGTDSKNLTGMAVWAFQAQKLKEIKLDVVVGAAYVHIASLKKQLAERGNATVHQQLPDLAKLMLKADFAIGAGGVTTWERCCLGLPSMVISIADNQRTASRALAADNIIQYLGHVDDITAELIRKQVLELIRKPEKLRELSEKSLKLVDGRGVNKVVEALKNNSGKTKMLTEGFLSC